MLFKIPVRKQLHHIAIVIKQSSRESRSFTKYHSFDEEGVSQYEDVTPEERQLWEDKINSFNTFSSVNPDEYEHEKDYLDDLRKE